MVSKDRLIAMLFGVIVVLAVVLVFDRGPSGFAVAQGAAAGGGFVGFLGQPSGNTQPVFVINSRDQVLLVYEYVVPSGGLALTAARTLRDDSKLDELNPMGATKMQHPSVKEIRKMIEKQH